MRSDHGVFGLPGDLFPWEIVFDPSDRAHVDPRQDGRVRFRLWAEPALANATLVLGVPHLLQRRLTRIAATARYTYWSAVVGPFHQEINYSFAFRSPTGAGVYLSPAGITVSIERLDRWQLDPPAAEPLSVPQWAKGAVIYQIFPDRFRNGDPSNDPPGTRAWSAPPTRNGFAGGDLDGITERLDYLDWLGIDLLYLNPIFTSPSNHRYDTIDYFSVDPALGGERALRHLVEEAHRRRIRIMLDVSLNHCHPRFFAFADLVEKGESSRYRDWFVVQDWPVRLQVGNSPQLMAQDQAWTTATGVPIERIRLPGRPRRATYETWSGVPTMPRLNLANPAARAYAISVITHWTAQFDIDGWRLDVARYVDPDFWDDLRRAVRAVRPDAFLLAEVMGDARQWLQGNRFDATMNYSFRDLVVGFLATQSLDGHQLLDGLTRLWAGYAEEVTLANHNLVSSHDSPRFASLGGGEEWRARLAAFLQMTFPGAPGLYYGDEIGLRGNHEPASRGTFGWDPDPSSHPLADNLRSLTRLRRRHPSLRRGNWAPIQASHHGVAYRRGRLLAVCNRGSRPLSLELASTALVWGEAARGGRGVWRLPPHAAAVLRS